MKSESHKYHKYNNLRIFIQSTNFNKMQMVEGIMKKKMVYDVIREAMMMFSPTIIMTIERERL